MKITETQFTAAQKTFSGRSLSDAHKQSMVASIYAKAKEVPAAPVISPLSGYFSFYRKRLLSSFAVVLLLISGGTYASASSLPGDALYGIKVRVLEPLGSAATFTKETKNEYRISLLQKRIDELEMLKKKTTPSTVSQAESAEATHRTLVDLERDSSPEDVANIARVSEKVQHYNALVDSELGIPTAFGIAVNTQNTATSTGTTTTTITASEPVEDIHATLMVETDENEKTHEEESKKEHTITPSVQLEHLLPVPPQAKKLFGL